MQVEVNYRRSEGNNSVFPQKVNQIRISPVKTKDGQTTRKSLKPFSSSIIQDKKKILSKEEIIKMNSQL
jgi:hypothetical protein